MRNLLLDYNTRVGIRKVGHSEDFIDISAGLCGLDAIVIHDWEKRNKVPIGFRRDVTFHPRVTMTYTYSVNDQDSSGIIRLYEFMIKCGSRKFDMVLIGAPENIVFLYKGSFSDYSAPPSQKEILAQSGNFFDHIPLAPFVHIKYELMFSEYKLEQYPETGISMGDGTGL